MQITIMTMSRSIVINIQDYKENMIILTDLIDGNLELLLSPFYCDSVGTEELNEDTR